MSAERPAPPDRLAAGITLLSYGLVLATLVVRVVMYFKGHSLWNDEAALAQSLVPRSFADLLATPLEASQSAPAFYCYAVKIAGALGGYSEGALRVYSLVAFIAALAVERALLRRALGLSEAWAAATLCATSLAEIYFRYSNELKPYTGDVFWILAVLLVHWSCTVNKAEFGRLAGVSVLAMGFSSPAVYFVAAIFAVQFSDAVTRRDGVALRALLKAAAMFGVLFTAYYVFWLKPAVGSMLAFWEGPIGGNGAYFFRAPVSIEALTHDTRLVTQLLDGPWLWYLPFALLGFAVSVGRGNRVSFAIGLGHLLLLAASMQHRWLLLNRVCLFVYAFIIMYLFVFAFELASRVTRSSTRAHAGLLALLAVFVVKDRLFGQFTKGRAYLPTEEANPLISYVAAHIQDGQALYVYPNAQWVMRYRNGYQSSRIGAVSRDNIIWGSTTQNWREGAPTEGDSDLARIVDAGKVYLLFYHYREEGGLEAGLAALQARGHLHQIGEFYKTPLYYFSTDAEDPLRLAHFDF